VLTLVVLLSLSQLGYPMLPCERQQVVRAGTFMQRLRHRPEMMAQLPEALSEIGGACPLPQRVTPYYECSTENDPACEDETDYRFLLFCAAGYDSPNCDDWEDLAR
jgi:hypothetical protein